MHHTRAPLAAALLFLLAASSLIAQTKKKPDPDDEGYVPVVAPESKNKKKDQDLNQTLPLPAELPLTVAAETDRLAFHVSPLSSRGLLSQQTRDALKALLKADHGTIVKLRAFVAGSGDLRRVGDLAGEIFTEKHQPLPVLTVVQVGALPREGAQVVIESIEAEKKVVDPNGVAFASVQPAGNVAESLSKLKSVLASAGIEPSNVLMVTCFVSSLDSQGDAGTSMAGAFPRAALDYVQMQRGPVKPVAACEARARMAKPASDVEPQIALVSSPQVVFTGTQLAFGSRETDLKLAFDRLEKALAARGTRLDQVVSSHVYLTADGLAGGTLAQQAARFGPHTPAGMMLPFEGLPSLDAPLGIEVVAVPDSSAQR
ncbi:MAG TPA: hypothetical protein VMB25_12165 [Bryobacteraceae bacterium]|nr:hypothetical protein [Bryobacteraceae bacterium]